MEYRVHEIAGSVSGEWTARAVRAMGSGSQAQHEHSGVGIAEAGDRLAPVLRVFVGATLFASDLFPVGDEARATSASDHFTVQFFQPVGLRHGFGLWALVIGLCALRFG